MERLICSWFMQPQAEQKSFFGNAPSHQGLAQYNNCYWRCVYTFYATARKTNPEVRLLFYTNLKAEELPQGEIDFLKFFEEQRVELISLPFNHCPPEGFYTKFMATFFMLDVFAHFTENYRQKESNVLLFDTDIVFLHHAEPFWNLLQKKDFAAYKMNFYTKGVRPPKDSCGLRQYMGELGYAELAEIYEQVYEEEAPEVIPIYGSECLGFNQRFLQHVYDRGLLEKCYQITLKRKEQGLATLITDEPFFSMLSFFTSPAYINDFLNRIEYVWSGFNVHRKKEIDLAIWHLPQEKESALKRLFQEISSQPQVWKELKKEEVPNFIAKSCRRNLKEVIYHYWKHILRHHWGNTIIFLKKIPFIYWSVIIPLRFVYRKLVKK